MHRTATPVNSKSDHFTVRGGGCKWVTKKKVTEGNVIESEGMFSFRGGFKGDKTGIFWWSEAGRPRGFPAERSELESKK